jgi:serine/threonine-protein kinase
VSLGEAYRLERELGGGGMSRVFLARDTELDRDVVVKVLAPDFVEGLSVERFTREIRLAARLQEPHIVPVLSAGATSDGMPYYAMPYVRGESLRARLSRGPVATREAVGILRDVALALAYAHGQSIVHRDIKPENVLLSEGTAVVTDFGIAKALALSTTCGDGSEAAIAPRTLTRAGVSLGTPAYMSPEQGAGDAVDPRTDIYAWGVLAYEMLAGRHPFGENLTAQQYIAAHISEAPSAAPLAQRAVPGALATLVLHCLEKSPERRPVSATELVAALDDARAPMRAPRARSRHHLLLVLAALALGALWWRASTGTTALPVRSVAVLPLQNLSGDPAHEYLADGMTDELIAELARFSQLRVVSRTSSMRFKGVRRPIGEIARELGVDAVVEGSVLRDGDRIRISAQFIRAADEQGLWADRYERDVRDLIQLQGDVALAIAKEVNAAAGARMRHDAARPLDPLAYELYLRGRYAAAGRGRPALEQAIGYLRQAIERDSGYAQAYAALADVHRLFGIYAYRPVREANAQARALNDRALRLDPRLAAAHALEAQFLADDLEWGPSLAAFRRALELDPGDAQARHRLSMTLAMLGRYDESLREARRAEALDPLSAPNEAKIASLLQLLGRREEGVRACRKAVALDATNPWPHYSCGMLHLKDGRVADALAEMREAGRLAPDHPMALAGLAAASARTGDTTRAAALLDELLRGRAAAASPFYVAVAYAALGNYDAAFRWLEREPWIGQTKFWLRTHDVFDPLRSDSRYARLMERLRLPP